MFFYECIYYRVDKDYNYFMIYWQLFISWFKISITTFGGGYSMLPMIEREIIKERGWVSNEEVLECYSIGQITPGIISVNAATLVGYKVKGTFGALCSTLGIVAPSVMLVSILSSIILQFYNDPIVLHALAGIQIGVCVLLVGSVYKMACASIKDYFSLIIFVMTFLVAFLTDISVIYIVIAILVAGLVFSFIKKWSQGNG